MIWKRGIIIFHGPKTGGTRAKWPTIERRKTFLHLAPIFEVRPEDRRRNTKYLCR
jgi:hypothetical protein